jgi:integrase
LKAPGGFGVRTTASGAKSYFLDYRLKGRQHRYTIGHFPDLSPLGAIRKALKVRREIDQGKNPVTRRDSPIVGTVLDEFIEQKVHRSDPPLRTGAEYARTFNLIVKPAIGTLKIYELQRPHIAEMLDVVERERGPVMRNRTLGYFRSALKWHAARDEGFSPPVVSDLVSAKPRDLLRTRVLSDAEIWRLGFWLKNSGTFGDIIKVLLLTGQSRDEVISMRRKEVDANWIWTIPATRHPLKRPHQVPLFGWARAILMDRPAGRLFFTNAQGNPITSLTEAKAELDHWLGPMPYWNLADLRRTAKAVMIREGVPAAIADRVLGRRVPRAGKNGQHDLDERRAALETLESAIRDVIKPDPFTDPAVMAKLRLPPDFKRRNGRRDILDHLDLGVNGVGR